MNDTEVTKLFAELGISNQQAATLRTILLPEARVLLDEFLISNTDNIMYISYDNGNRWIYKKLPKLINYSKLYLIELN